MQLAQSLHATMALARLTPPLNCKPLSTELSPLPSFSFLLGMLHTRAVFEAGRDRQTVLLTSVFASKDERTVLRVGHLLCSDPLLCNCIAGGPQSGLRCRSLPTLASSPSSLCCGQILGATGATSWTSGPCSSPSARHCQRCFDPIAADPISALRRSTRKAVKTSPRVWLLANNQLACK